MSFKKYKITLSLLIIASVVFGQSNQNQFNQNLAEKDYVDLMFDKTANVYDAIEKFNQAWYSRPYEKGKGWKAFKRWEYMNEERTFPSGEKPSPTIAWDEFMKWREENPQSRSTNGAWTQIGPTSIPSSGGGAGRINCIRFHPTDANTIFAGAPSGGLWKSTNNGTSWTCLTDNLPVIGVTDLAIDPSNPNIMYMATGDAFASDTYSIGILKTTDGGATWNTTGLNWNVTATDVISRVLINPNNTSIILAATSNGIYRSTNGGNTFTQTATGNFLDMEFKPGDPNTVYISGTSVRYSTNGGTSFTAATGIPTGQQRIAIAVSAANPAYVYALIANSTDYGFYGLYRSTNSGTSFSARSTTPNVLGYNASGSDAGGQGWYDLAICASETNAEEIYVGGINIWRSTNGGTSWVLNAHWTGANNKPYVHADIHDLIYKPGTTQLYAGCDGGVFRTSNSGTSWTDISNNLSIAMMYRLSNAQTNANIVLTGWQDNGTNRRGSTGAWTNVIGGDGMECIIDYSNSNNMYGSLYYGEIYRSTNGGNSFPTNIVQSGGTGVNADGEWVTPYVMSPTSATTLFVGKAQLYKSTNSGTAWAQVGTISGGSGGLKAIAVAPSNVNYIYIAKRNKIWRSTDGATFTDITGTLPVNSASITYIAVSNTDPQKVWVTFSGYSAANKVFRSTNGGTSWTNISTGLPNLPVNCVVYQNNSDDGIYVGTDVGVYYRSNSVTSWQSFSTGLPNVIVSELEIYYTTNRLRAATYGRGLWESDLYTPGNTPPVSNFTLDNNTICQGATVQFTDLSTNSPTSWNWTFQGGTPSTSTSQNPSVTYNTPGIYDVTLVAANANGSNSSTQTTAVTVVAIPVVNVNPQQATICKGESVILNASGAITYNWSPVISITSSTAPTITATPQNNVTYTLTGYNTGCPTGGSTTVTITVNQPPATPTITWNGTELSSSSATGNQWYLNGNIIPGATGQTYTPVVNGQYTVIVTDANGCKSLESTKVTTNVGIDEAGTEANVGIFPNPNTGEFYVQFELTQPTDLVFNLIDMTGKSVYSLKSKGNSGLFKQQIDISQLSAGVYTLKIQAGKNTISKKIIKE